MTLILTLGNADQVIQVSDRRLSWNGQLKEDESSKAGLLTCLNARLAFGFTGIARMGSFCTRDWLLQALMDSMPPDCTAANVLERLRLRASETFRLDPSLCKSPRKDRRLSIMFSGYLYHHEPPLQAFAILTNYQNFQTGQDEAEAWDEFSPPNFWYEKRPADGEPTFIQYVGNWRAITPQDRAAFRELLEARKPAQAIIGKAIELVRQMSDRPAAGNTIGKQLSAIQIPRDPKLSTASGYHSIVNGYVTYLPDFVAMTPSGIWGTKDARLIKVGGLDASPSVVPKVGRNQPCPCGSKKKYKYCHGRPLPTPRRP